MTLRTKLTEKLGIRYPILQAPMGGSADDTLRTRIFDVVNDARWPVEFTGRVLAKRFSEAWHGRERELEEAADTKARYAEASRQGDFDTAVVWGGEAIDLIHTVEPAGAIVARIVAEAEAALARRFD